MPGYRNNIKMVLWLGRFLILYLAVVQSKIIFVNEVSRHGSRAPFGDYPEGVFPNGKQMLTASGMRQHYLLGQQLRAMYVSERDGDEKLLSKEYNPEEIYVKSTQMPRTIQSAYSQLLGLYPRKTYLNQCDIQIEEKCPSLRSQSPFDEDIIYSDLAQMDYHPIPVHNEDGYLEEIVHIKSCNYIINSYMNRTLDFSYWKEEDDKYRKTGIYDKIAQAFNKSSKDIDIQTVFHLIDAILIENFEGIPPRANFTTEEINLLKGTQRPNYVLKLDYKGKALVASRFLNPVLEAMKARIGLPYNKISIKNFEKAKFVYFSSHDLHMTMIISFLNVTNIEIDYISFASVIIIELHQHEKESCYGLVDKTCFYVRIFFDNDQLKLNDCKSIDCTFKEFETFLKDKGYPPDMIDKECTSEPVMYTREEFDNGLSGYITARKTNNS
ncbi:unnamed protein product [Moneuplotes crassus]|uniref:Acid phosphatase n=1 Tax=Euplotes crassus TaxID=5936 RepID=A0AAD1XEG8_EUPCR|nr:unnamed protein product [Moneuplotes crassus]